MPDHAHIEGLPVLTTAVLVVAAAAVFFYLRAARRPRRGAPWDTRRSVLWIVGVTAAAASAVLPPHGDFTSHMASHVVLGMLAPLLLVLAAPVTLALRTLEIVPARRLSRLLRTAPLRFVGHPIVAALLSVGGAWVLYLTPLHAVAQQSALLAMAVNAHLLGSGYLFAAAILAVDPSPHRAGYGQRATVLVLALAAHDILAKQLYAAPPAGVDVASAEAGAQLMYYAGGAVEVVIMVLLCARWYAAAGARHPLAAPRDPATMDG